MGSGSVCGRAVRVGRGERVWVVRGSSGEAGGAGAGGVSSAKYGGNWVWENGGGEEGWGEYEGSEEWAWWGEGLEME